MKFLIDAIYWMWAFIVPAGVLAFIGFVIYLKSETNLPYAILLTAVGCIGGVWVAESIRKKHGLSHFFSRLMATPDLDRKDDGEK